MHTLMLPLHLPLRLLPDTIHSFAFARGFNHLMRGQSISELLAELEDKSLCIHIRDTDTYIRLRIGNGRLHPALKDAQDVTISASLPDFWNMATGRADPDTLFFQRRLCIEGDTAAGVHIKNLLDALDYDLDRHFDAVLITPLAEIAREVHQQFRILQGKKDY